MLLYHRKNLNEKVRKRRWEYQEFFTERKTYENVCQTTIWKPEGFFKVGQTLEKFFHGTIHGAEAL